MTQHPDVDMPWPIAGTEGLDEDDDDSKAAIVPASAMGAMVRSEVEAQLSAAHRYPRSIKTFLREAVGLATEDVEVAESCIYTLKRKDEHGAPKLITGPSVRMAELAASAYRNLHVGARIIDDDDKFITAQGVAWDLEKNLRIQVDTRRRITTKKGHRYGDDMIVVTGNAAASIAFRNAVFRVIPRSYITKIMVHVRKVAVGDAQTLKAKRLSILNRLETRGVTVDRVLFKLGRAGVEDIGLEDLEVLIGLGTSLASGEETIDELFPVTAPTPAPAAPADDGRRISLGKKEKGPGNDSGQEG